MGLFGTCHADEDEERAAPQLAGKQNCKVAAKPADLTSLKREALSSDPDVN